MDVSRVALVTGANRGIGLEIVRQLMREFKGVILLGARNAESGSEAVSQLRKGWAEGSPSLGTPRYLQLDVSSVDSIEQARKFVSEEYGRLDVLVNNAGVMMNVSETDLADRARQTININFHGTYNMIKSFWDLFQANSRIVNLSSGLGNIKYLSNEWQSKLTPSKSNLTIDQLVNYMDQYVKDCASPNFSSTGWHENTPQYSDSYSVSKIGVNVLTSLLADKLSTDPRPGILVNSVCPGWVNTDMGGSNATRSVDKGAETPMYLALLPPGTSQPQGQFLRDKKSLPDKFSVQITID